MRLTAERLFSDPALTGRLPARVRFSPDGLHVTYLAAADDDRERLDLHHYDVTSGRTELMVDARELRGNAGAFTEAALTEAEKAERERKRFFTGGITEHRWLASGRELLLVCAGEVFLGSVETRSFARITPPGARHTDVTCSPGGRYVSWVRDGELHCFTCATGTEARLTHDASATVSNGIAEFIAQEEMHRFEGHWWSQDDAWLAYTRVDTSPVRETLRYEIGADGTTAHAQRYPYAGDDNARVDLVLLSVATGRPRTIDYRDADDDYLVRVAFGHGVLAVQVQSRDQRRLRVKLYNLTDDECTIAVTEEASTWVNLHESFVFLPDSDDFLMISERGVRARLHLVRDGRCTSLTPDRGRVNRIVHADRTHAWFLGWLEAPVEQHLFRVALAGDEEPVRLTAEPGWHDALLDRTGRRFVDLVSRLDHPPRLVIRDAAAGTCEPLVTNDLNEAHPYRPYLASHRTPELGTIGAEDGQPLWYRLTLPQPFDPGARHPVIVNVYGGPGVQRVRNEWAPLALQLFAQAGFAVFELDNRGGGNRDKAFEDVLHGRLGRVEVADQLRGVDFLLGLPWVDPKRLGIMGHSYGGFMTLVCLCTAPGRFRAGVAGAPVTDWALYDTHYTERYLGTPRENPDGYRDSSPLTHLDRLEDALLVIHGMADDNVLFTHSTRLFKALQDRQSRFEMMTYPGAKHALQQRSVAIHRQTTILEFFTRHLLEQS